MINLAGQPKEICDAQCRKELQEAGIPVHAYGIEQFGEVKTEIIGLTNGDQSARAQVKKPVWKFRRAWYYWIAELCLPCGNQFNMEKAKAIHATHGKEVRVAGHCGAPAPQDWWGEDGIPHLYHIDTQEGLNVFAKAIME